MRYLFIFLASCWMLLAPVTLYPQLPANDSTSLMQQAATDTMAPDTVVIPVQDIETILQDNRWLGYHQPPVSYPEAPKNRAGQNFIFYYILFLLALFALCRAAFPKYFSNLFRVFFNTSLRQGQITDQLLQAKLPSLLFNVLFVFTAGFYLYLLLMHSVFRQQGTAPWLLAVIVAAVAIMYIVKYAVIRFTGWVSGYTREADAYVFIVFLVNKIIGVVLLPILLIMAFSKTPLSEIGFTVSVIVIVLIFLLRFLRSYENLHRRLQVSRFHFLLYLVGVEILPLLIIYKAAMKYLPDFA